MRSVLVDFLEKADEFTPMLFLVGKQGGYRDPE